MLGWLESHPGIATWAQGFASIMTLWVALGVPAWQRRVAQMDTEMALGPVLVRVIEILSMCETFITQKHADPERYLAELKSTVAELSNVPASDLRPALIRPFSTFRGHAHDAIHRYTDELQDAGHASEIQALTWVQTYLTLTALIKSGRELELRSRRLELTESLNELEQTVEEREPDAT